MINYMFIAYIKAFAYLLICLLIKVVCFENIFCDLNHRLTYYELLAIAFCAKARWRAIGLEDQEILYNSFANFFFEDIFL